MTKAQLPRKRKKRATGAQGRQWYYGTIKLHHLLVAEGRANPDKQCQFWVNSSIVSKPTIIGGRPIMVPQATVYW